MPSEFQGGAFGVPTAEEQALEPRLDPVELLRLLFQGAPPPPPLGDPHVIGDPRFLHNNMGSMGSMPTVTMPMVSTPHVLANHYVRQRQGRAQ